MICKPRQSQALNASPKSLVLAYHHSMLVHRESDAAQRCRPGTQLSVNGFPLWHECGGHETKTYLRMGRRGYDMQLRTLSTQVRCRQARGA